MANNDTSAAANQKKQLKEEKKRLKQEEKKQKQDIKKRAREIAKRESEIDEQEDSGGVSSVFVTFVIVLVWLVILCILIKMDVGGFGSEILTPLLKDVPVVNKILPATAESGYDNDGSYGGYSSLKEAVDYIKVLELELEHEQNVNASYQTDLTEAHAEIDRLQEFEKMQVEFQRIKEQFYEEIIYADNGPGAEEYRKYYESMDPTTAEALYKQVVRQLEEAAEMKDYAAAYSSMKPKEAAAIFESMVDSGKSTLVARILDILDSDTRGKILGVMDEAKAAQITVIMNPEG